MSRHSSRRKVNSLNPFLLAAVKAPLVPQLLLLPFWPVKILCPSRALTAGAKERFLQERVVFRRITTTTAYSRVDRRMERKPPDGVGRHSRKVDLVLPGKHTRLLYDQLSWKEASVLAQLRTGMARLNGYLYQIRAAPSDECPCGRAKETMEHFLFRCVKWTTQRKEIFQCTNEKRGNLSFHLRGKAASDGQE
jgi:hypothetical protein